VEGIFAQRRAKEKAFRTVLHVEQKSNIPTHEYKFMGKETDFLIWLQPFTL